MTYGLILTPSTDQQTIDVMSGDTTNPVMDNAAMGNAVTDEPLLTADWYSALPHLLRPDDIVATASLGITHPDWLRRREQSYPSRVALIALAIEPELLHGIRRAGIEPRMRVLDAACGSGVISRLLLEAGADAVVGCDISHAMLDLARALPTPPRSSATLSFEQVDLAQPLPFADASFDAVWFSDIWIPAAMPELRRVLRPGGRLVLHRGHLAGGLTYAWDYAFDRRIASALMTGFARAHGGATADATQSLYGQLQEAGPWRHSSLFTVIVERTAPVPRVYEESLRQGFGLFVGPFVQNEVSEDDWRQLVALYDESSPDYMFRRPDAHFISTLTFAVGVKD